MKTPIYNIKYLFLLIIVLAFSNCINSNSQNSLSIKIDSEENTVDTVEKIVEKQILVKPKIIADIPVPDGFKRLEIDSGSYASYLRHLPIKQENNIVLLYDGTQKYNQKVQFAVLDIDVGNRDLQQCSDAVVRVRAEYLYANKRYNEIHFNFLSDGKPRYYNNYVGNDKSYKKFRKYLNYIFAYANTGSLHDEMQSVDFEDMKIGDVFVQKRRPYGHAIQVVDMAKNEKTNEIIFMLTQSYMPAQEIHILNNLNNKKINPWYSGSFDGELFTPEWIFTKNDLKRFK